MKLECWNVSKNIPPTSTFFLLSYSSPVQMKKTGYSPQRYHQRYKKNMTLSHGPASNTLSH